MTKKDNIHEARESVWHARNILARTLDMDQYHEIAKRFQRLLAAIYKLENQAVAEERTIEWAEAQRG